MDTTLSIALIVLVVSAALLIVISAAEAAIGSISRGRLHAPTAGQGLNDLLDSYIRQRQTILRSLTVGGSIVMISLTVSLVIVFTITMKPGLFAEVVAGATALFLSTALRQTARTFALVNPAATGVRLAMPITVLQWLFGPIGWGVAAPARAVVRMLGRDPDAAEANPAGELLAVLERTESDNEDNSLTEERRMMRGILAMSEQTVREILSPRPDVAAVPVDASFADVTKLIAETGFSRIPVFEESLDHVVGVIYAKDLLRYLHGDVRNEPTLTSIARPPYFVPESKRADDLLADMRRNKVHMAIAVDEYGGTAGVVTVEDLLEEIVGEIADEYDVEDLEVQHMSADEAIVDAGLPIDDLNELFGTEIDSEDFDTVGGLVLALLGRIAGPGDEVESEDHRISLRVLSVLGRRIKRVRVRRVHSEEPTSGK
ncbi:MAG: HlyC/CorC family transporter [Chloroflexi bacterium]|nr:MAG: HlyC/CorC family transporter [Chloroflexota bacterium]